MHNCCWWSDDDCLIDKPELNGALNNSSFNEFIWLDGKLLFGNDERSNFRSFVDSSTLLSFSFDLSKLFDEFVENEFCSSWLDRLLNEFG